MSLPLCRYVASVNCLSKSTQVTSSLFTQGGPFWTRLEFMGALRNLRLQQDKKPIKKISSYISKQNPNIKSLLDIYNNFY